MPPELWSLYRLMLKSRLLEEAIAKLWHDGLISGEMHLGTGEEAIIAGVVTQLHEGDAMALDHRGTAALLMRGIDPVAILRELLGYSDGLCGGTGGHMHLFSREHLAVSSGIVGAAGPTAAGFALSAQYVRPGAIAVAFFGEGAMNQGMLMESMNLASAWNLPVLFVCKDDGWAITTQSDRVTGGNVNERARGLGIPAVNVDGGDIADVWEAAHSAIERARSGQGPTFLHARCVHLEGHFLGFHLLRIMRDPLREIPVIAVPLTQSLLRPAGAAWRERLAGLQAVCTAVLSTLRDPRQDSVHDPVRRTRTTLQSDSMRLQELENQVEKEVSHVLASALAQAPS
ncbi:pyruvate dehydrogenase E1 subunit alpha [Candidatus Methylomirabilis lanthanidiphila]|uniref:Pyruvate dehydrogenase E1 subunit alpha n=1 Tax=Candidatus Methylomirabilis lanthanidiphila TaxID=2211376 RepID=A0A564ZJ60_9BACT|nr:thiamine pyrophosphate-dependent dehydrogenase E1 component subunit alpha [Candidatus Methylomirabilis lanthanidiphila]VUZ85355.1 pyruvate dehydrogenase E1 subunit alpha [Candidatus Methylomirabilis lanthanidiphila]